MTPMASGDPSRWRNPAFIRLWSASTVSYFGSFITRTALPLAAIYQLKAGPLEITALRSLELVGYLVFSLVAGAWVDRLLRRPVMVVADLGRVVLLGSIPLAAIAGVLNMPQLLIVAFLAAALEIFFETASRAYLPTIIEPAGLVGANSALSASASAAEFTGFGVSGFLVQLFTAPIAIAIDAVSFLASAILLVTIRRSEPPPPARADREPVLHEIREGIRVVARSPILRALTSAHAANHVLWGAFGTVYLLFATQEIGLGAAAIGIVAALGGLGSFLGAALTSRIAARVGLGMAMMLGLAGLALGNALVPIVPAGAVAVGFVLLVAQQLIGDGAGTIYGVLETSLTQTVVEGRILGRVNATADFVTTVTALLGAVIGGLLADAFGLRAAMVFGVIGGATAVVFIWFSPIRSMHAVPAGVEAATIRVDEMPVTE